ncbi:hypothetical protein OGZ02_16165 [Brachyspira hyodysenteriae]|nr:hypothetical protein [Brachyspira hyodysenteriae]MDA1470306.1 hypothetical protein [Brachyspira hyodysenteriae]
MKNNTPIKKEYEPKRIFTKILNPLSCKYKKLGTDGGHISNKIINFSDLLYNNINFRDINKDKNITRSDFKEHNNIQIDTNSYFDYMIQKQKD